MTYWSDLQFEFHLTAHGGINKPSFLCLLPEVLVHACLMHFSRQQPYYLEYKITIPPTARRPGLGILDVRWHDIINKLSILCYQKHVQFIQCKYWSARTKLCSMNDIFQLQSNPVITTSVYTTSFL